MLPELATTGYVFRDRDEAGELAEPLDGPGVTEWCELAAIHNLVVVGGVCELDETGLLRNSAVIVDQTGVRACYRKVHLWDAEQLVFTPGEQAPPVVDVVGRRIGVLICYDLEFPEWVRLPALAGAQLLCVPTNWPRFPRPDGERPMEVVRTQAAASGNRMFVAACDRVGRERDVDWVGGSVIVDPDGWPVAGPESGDDERLLIADCALELAWNKTIGARNDVHGDRRPNLYAPITESRAHEAGRQQ